MGRVQDHVVSPCEDCVDTRVCHICGGRGRSEASGIPTDCPACNGSGVCTTCGTAVAAKSPRRTEGALTAAEAGTVGSSPLVHAVGKTLNGNKARCGAGSIIGQVTGRFVPDAPGSCPDCSLM
ncbi:MAG: hypothetical protein QOI82_2653 [Actinomycetota bacterium]|jgi:hypothetical protein|nr:hypothetical protein [Actinomycetota bacterium]